MIRNGAPHGRVLHSLSRLAYESLEAGTATVEEFHGDEGCLHWYVTAIDEGRELSGRSRKALARTVRALEKRLA